MGNSGLETPTPVYAPILGMAVYADTQKITDGKLDGKYTTFLPIGEPEEGSKLEMLPVFVGPDSDKRYVRSNVKLTYYDMEARKIVRPYHHVEATGLYGRCQNKLVHVDLLCGSGCITLYNLTYTFYAEHLGSRGMRWVHSLTGKVKYPEFITYLDDGWNEFVAKVRFRSSPVLVDNKLFSI